MVKTKVRIALVCSCAAIVVIILIKLFDSVCPMSIIRLVCLFGRLSSILSTLCLKGSSLAFDEYGWPGRHGIQLRKLNQPFTWNEKDESELGNETDDDSTTNKTVRSLACRNSVQGKTLIADDRGNSRLRMSASLCLLQTAIKLLLTSVSSLPCQDTCATESTFKTMVAVALMPRQASGTTAGNVSRRAAAANSTSIAYHVAWTRRR